MAVPGPKVELLVVIHHLKGWLARLRGGRDPSRGEDRRSVFLPMVEAGLSDCNARLDAILGGEQLADR